MNHTEMNLTNFGLTIFVLLLINILVVHSKIRGSDYPQLISDVHHLYGTSSVVIVHNCKADGIASLLRTVQWLSNSGIPSVVADIKQLSEVQTYYRKRIKWDLYAVFLGNYEAIQEFEKIMKKIDVAQSVWFIIFTSLRNKFIFNDYCTNPHGNPFNLGFNTRMLIKCYDEEILREWYSIYENMTSVFDLATWNPNNRLTLLNKESLFRRRKHVGGVSLKIMSVNGSPLVFEKCEKLSGFFGEILEQLSTAINFKIKLIGNENEYGAWKNDTKEWTGITKQLYMNKIDLAAADMIMSTRRLDAVDFSVPLVTSRLVLYFKESNNAQIQQLGYFLPFSNGIWMIIVVLVITTPILLTLIKMKTKQTNDLVNLLSENYLNIWGIFCQQGLPDFPTVTSLRLAYFSIFISALILSSVYSAVLISYLTVPSTLLPFTTLKGFIEDGSYKLMVLKHSVHYQLFEETKNPLLLEMKNLMEEDNNLPSTSMEAVKQLCNNKIAFFTTEITIDTRNLPKDCKIAWIKAGDTNSLSLPLKKGSQYTGIIDFYLKRFFESGILYHFKHNNRPINNENSNTGNNVEVTLSCVRPILQIVIVGTILSLLLLIAEKIYILYNKNFVIRNKVGQKARKNNKKFRMLES